MGKLIYIATPYTNYPLGRDAAFEEACEIAARMMDQGYEVYSPIVHFHPINGHLTHVGKGGIDFWWDRNLPILRVSDVLVIAAMTSWRESSGIAREVEFFADKKLPVFLMDPLTLAMTSYVVECVA